MRSAILTAAALLHLTALAWAGEDPPPVTGSHAALSCDECHPPSGLADCKQCHEEKKNIHPVAVEPSIPIPREFSLDEGGRLLCRTCHKLHAGNPATKYLNTQGLGVETDRAAFCARCHGERMVRANPHQARQGTRRCAFCHASIPDEAGERRPTARIDIVRLCDFCHGAVAKNHPRNVDPSLSLPKGLPLGQDGSWNCATCHEPHGTISTTHYIRPEFAQHFERGRQANPHVESYFACQACHSSSVTAEIRAPDFKLRYKGDINILCVSCHVTDRGHHPTGVPPPFFMVDEIKASGKNIPLDAEGRITCYSCHDNGCSTGRQKMRARYYDGAKLESELCWICHKQKEFSGINPHREDPKLCTQCHESRPIPGLSLGLMAVPKMICLRCHDVKPHPANADHLKVPSGKIRTDSSLPLGAGGKITCVTCHDPHGREQGHANRLRDPSGSICQLCHSR